MQQGFFPSIYHLHMISFSVPLYYMVQQYECKKLYIRLHGQKKQSYFTNKKWKIKKWRCNLLKEIPPKYFLGSWWLENDTHKTKRQKSPLFAKWRVKMDIFLQSGQSWKIPLIALLVFQPVRATHIHLNTPEFIPIVDRLWPS